ncbi:MAG TPA: molybdopterin-dependent oxidoreductase [Vicinamibacterales bacterium]|nr:molybdopterin-dependent oxidoreductase [Vicinamibacterales bacterium]
METVTLTIDGKEVTVEKGKTVLQAAIEAGISVPYYCYHPALGVDGSCRVCVVKIEKMPKLQTSCSMVCTEGMVVHTQTPDVAQARAGVLEFLLINHPLDCPVCDKGGECPLQDFAYSFGPGQSRMEFPRRVFDGEGVKADVDFGPTLMLNRNRCILCTRCVRFMRDIDGDAQIGIVDRGAGSEIATFQEEGVHSLLSGNLMDVCPVGAITTRDYRFKSRPWDNLDAVDTICTFCSKGCNTTAWLRAKPEWAKGARLVRITPRLNPEVNSYWMCDIGRFEYHWIEGEERLHKPLLRDDAGQQSPATWEEALDVVAKGCSGGLTVLSSAHASNEELFLIQRVASQIALSWRFREKPQPANTKFKVPAADAPNINGARDLGLPTGRGNDGPPDLSVLRAEIEAGRISALYVFDPGPPDSLGDVNWIAEARRSGRLAFLAYHGVVMSELARAADVVLPGAAWVEKESTYTNDQGRVQAAARVLPLPGDAKDDREILLRVAEATGQALPYKTPEDVREALADALQHLPAYRDLRTIAFGQAVAVQNWLQASNPSERWKWDYLFQDLAPVKFPWMRMPEPRAIPLKPIAAEPRVEKK